MQGIDADTAKKISQHIRDQKLKKVQAQIQGDAVRVTFEDTAPPFNPYARLPEESPDTTIEMRKIGGLGVLLTRELASVRDYAYLHGRNCVRLRLAC